MKRASRASAGSAAIELAVMLPFILMLWTVPLFLGRVWWHYTVSLGAVQDAQLYLSQMPVSVMGDPTLAPLAKAAADDILTAELAELRPGDYPVGHEIRCDTMQCAGYTVPTTVQASTQQEVQDPLYAQETNEYFDAANYFGLYFTTYVNQPYVGR